MKTIAATCFIKLFLFNAFAKILIGYLRSWIKIEKFQATNTSKRICFNIAKFMDMYINIKIKLDN